MTGTERLREYDFTRRHFNALRAKANEYSGIQVSDDKYEMFYARLAKRLRALKITSFDDYVRLVGSDTGEFKAFINAITTNVTAFEREPHHFAFLKQALSELPSQSVAIWSAGCSSGQEPYSIIVNAWDICQRRRLPLSITATDLDTDVLERASQGIYKLEDIAMYDTAVKRKFFEKGTGSREGFCRVKKAYRQLITFKQLNLIHPWQAKPQYQFIFCRNVLIYFDGPQKQRIINQFADCLLPRGILMLGHSESLQQANTRFENIGKNVYRKREEG
ncbi:protein-glutamate O-methyltransferase CheR [Aestuariibacter halophilus]|uniref:Chemotaxis protein methyltransferase n=1 Tax=Fluctibacter halophilus TaxID=226011 RepID=A0ABS8G670_9ALTE|nr:protein-glutamate O-methyltransferase CheR [Aestuariibacter halophilus]MCC2616030.1 protein-glutamate O-methyltransferase CheR [Aestuariibacter halophilus]